MRRTIGSAVAVAAALFVMPALADHDGDSNVVPGGNSTTCLTNCDANGNPSLPNTQWEFGDTHVISSGDKEHIDVDVSNVLTNIANDKSGGKASTKNQSNFNVQTTVTTTTTWTETTSQMDAINPSTKNVVAAQSPTVKTVEDFDQDVDEQEGSREHVHPSDAADVGAEPNPGHDE